MSHKPLPKHVQWFQWFEEQIKAHSDWPEPIKSTFPKGPELDNFVRYWMLWNIERGFLHVWLDQGEPVGGIIWRPCAGFNDDLKDIEYFDTGGDSLWVDFLYAPNRWNDCVLPFIKSTGKKFGGWYRRDNGAFHVVEIEKLRPIKSMLIKG